MFSQKYTLNDKKLLKQESIFLVYREAKQV